MATLVAPTWNDVQATHDAASNGDIIQVSAGTYTVNTGTSISKAITLIADGEVTLIDSTPNVSNLLSIQESTAASLYVWGFKFVQGSALHSNPNGVVTVDQISGGKPVVFRNCTYTQVYGGGDFIIWRANRGVVALCSMFGFPAGPNCLNNASFVRQKPGDGTWETPLVYGNADTNGNKALYIESCEIKNVAEAIDVDSDGRMVLRYSTFTNSGTGSHGADTNPVGGRYIEYDHVTFIRDLTPCSGCPGGIWPNVLSFIFIRGGTALIHDCVIPQLFDAAWGDKSEVNFALEQLHRGLASSGNFACWAGGYPAPHQPGWGYTTGGTSLPTSPVLKQDLQPIYIWNNTGAGNHAAIPIVDYAPDECPGNAGIFASSYVQEGREYHYSAKPGFTPYVYPHPLIDETGSGSGEPPSEGGGGDPIPPDPEIGGGGGVSGPGGLPPDLLPIDRPFFYERGYLNDRVPDRRILPPLLATVESNLILNATAKETVISAASISMALSMAGSGSETALPGDLIIRPTSFTFNPTPGPGIRNTYTNGAHAYDVDESTFMRAESSGGSGGSTFGIIHYQNWQTIPEDLAGLLYVTFRAKMRWSKGANAHTPAMYSDVWDIIQPNFGLPQSGSPHGVADIFSFSGQTVDSDYVEYISHPVSPERLAEVRDNITARCVVVTLLDEFSIPYPSMDICEIWAVLHYT